MELELSLGEPPAHAKVTTSPSAMSVRANKGENHELVLELGVGIDQRAEEEEKQQEDQQKDMQSEDVKEGDEERFPNEPPVKLSLRPLLPDTPQTGNEILEVCTLGFDVNTTPVLVESEVKAKSLTALSSQVELPVRRAADQEAGEDEENDGRVGVRKKLRLSKEQAAFLEESFKEHSTLNPKQKLNLAERLSLRPRQVEVWFQNRRARTKLKQTEVDCEYLKRCCETLTQENRRLQREVAELRAFRTKNPFYTHLSATSAVSFCLSCDKITTCSSPPITSGTMAGVSSPASTAPSMPALFTKSRFRPFTVHRPPMLHRRP